MATLDEIKKFEAQQPKTTPQATQSGTATETQKRKRNAKPLDASTDAPGQLAEAVKGKAVKAAKGKRTRKAEIMKEEISEAAEERLFRHQAREKAEEMIDSVLEQVATLDAEVIEAEEQADVSFDELFNEVGSVFFGKGCALELEGFEAKMLASADPDHCS